MFPPHVFHDQAIFDWESREIFRHEWRCVGREEETPNPGSYRLLEFAGEQVIVHPSDRIAAGTRIVPRR